MGEGEVVRVREGEVPGIQMGLFKYLGYKCEREVGIMIECLPAIDCNREVEC